MRVFLEERAGFPPFYSCRADMPVEVHDVYLFCRSLDTDERPPSPESARLEREPPSELFDLAAYGAIDVGL